MDGTLIMSERKRKSDMDLIKIINCYNPKNQKFEFGCHKSQGISRIDLSNINKSTKFGDDDRLIKKYFTDVKIVKKKHIAKAYEKALEKETPEDNRRMRKHDSRYHIFTRWDTSMIHKAIKEILVEKNQVPSTQLEEQSSKEKRHKKIAKKCKTTDAEIAEAHSKNEGQNMENIIGLDHNVINNDEGNDQNVNKNTGQTDEPENIRINETQTKFDKLFGEEMIRLDAILFNEFKKARSIAEKRYITLREMMAYAMDASNRECLVLGQTNKMLNDEITNAHNAEMLKIQTKTSANTLKINDYLKHIGSLKKKLKEAQSNADVQKNVNEGKQYATEGKEQTRTLVQNTKVEATQMQVTKVEETKGELTSKTCVKSNLKRQKKKIKEYYRQYQLDYFWLMSKTWRMTIELVVMRSDLTSLFVDGLIDAKLIDVFFYIMSENETKVLYIQLYEHMKYIFFPLFHYNHFSLVVLDTNTIEITHYNYL
ncbi:signal recognition particle subunit SRP68-like [Pyrus ussuriensis x Pyrus communis]|uniref:Signal recognition particle subunit SRP68-like n=1 Tax=Pyrus ussuriensis x Pyrus communis TaxID=2448454 RepID=A0A5N5I963_9ROSA|nr:signal recognition particle subunit SRP68-like [Pyrus ussuriensis x Pyrus communis]